MPPRVAYASAAVTSAVLATVPNSAWSQVAGFKGIDDVTTVPVLRVALDRG